MARHATPLPPNGANPVNLLNIITYFSYILLLLSLSFLRQCHQSCKGHLTSWSRKLSFSRSCAVQKCPAIYFKTLRWQQV